MVAVHLRTVNGQLKLIETLARYAEILRLTWTFYGLLEWLTQGLFLWPYSTSNPEQSICTSYSFTENIALNKRAGQTFWLRADRAAGKAVDGHLTENTGCATPWPDKWDSARWWVDLEGTYRVQLITLTNTHWNINTNSKIFCLSNISKTVCIICIYVIHVWFNYNTNNCKLYLCNVLL